MKMVSLFLILNCWFAKDIGAQKRLFAVAPGEKVLETIPKVCLYSHAEFTEGVIHYNNQKTHPYKLNYDILFDQMEYLTPQGDVVVLDNEDRIEYIIIDKDTFYKARFYFKH